MVRLNPLSILQYYSVNLGQLIYCDMEAFVRVFDCIMFDMVSPMAGVVSQTLLYSHVRYIYIYIYIYISSS